MSPETMSRKSVRKLRLQSAMEYLMTYGWAILIISVILGTLYQIGVFNSSSLSVRAPAGECKVLRTSAAVNLVGQCSSILPQYVAQFDGATSYVTSPVTISWATMVSSGATFSAWIKTSATATGGIVGQNRGGGCTYYCEGGLEINIAQNKVSMVVYNGINYITASSSSAVNNGQWHYVVGTYTSNYIAVYVDGVLNQGTSFGAGTYLFPVGSSIGLQDTGGSPLNREYFSGQIADVQEYNTSLDASSIATLYQEGIGGAPVNPQYIVGWWPLDGDSNDYSGSNNNGAQNAMTFVSQYGK